MRLGGLGSEGPRWLYVYRDMYASDLTWVTIHTNELVGVTIEGDDRCP